EATLALVGVEQDAARLDPFERQHQPRNATAGTQVEESSGRTHQARERPGMVDVVLDRARTHHAQGLRLLQHTDQLPGRAHRYAGRSTTRRRGSSPSDSLATPSIVPATSWTTFRSAAD